MKFKHVAVVCALGVSFLAGCGGSGPKDVAEDGVKAWLKGDLDTYVKTLSYSPDEHQKAFLKNELPRRCADMGFTVDKIDFANAMLETEEDEALVTIPVKGVSEVGRLRVFLKKKDGDWKIGEIEPQPPRR